MCLKLFLLDALALGALLDSALVLTQYIYMCVCYN